MNIFSERSSSRYTQRNFVSECQTPSIDSHGYISVSKELNIPLISTGKQSISVQRKQIKLFDSPHFNDNTNSTLSSHKSKKEVDILSKLMNWEKMQGNPKFIPLKRHHELLPKTEHLRNQNPMFQDIKQKGHAKYLNQQTVQQQAPKSFVMHDTIQPDVEMKESEYNQMESLDPLNTMKNQHELNQYVIQVAKTNNRILPKLQLPEKNEKAILKPNFHRQKRLYSVIDTFEALKFGGQDDSVFDDNEYQQFRKRKAQFKRYQLRKRIIVVLAVIRISRKHRLILKERALYSTSLDQSKSVHQKYLDQFRTKNLLYHQKEFAEGIFKKLNSSILDKKYLKECQEISMFQDSVQKDIKKQRFCQLALLLLQSLEIATQQNVLPQVIVHLLNLNFYKSSTSQSCLFVSKRACYYTAFVCKITRKQQLLLATEFLMFQTIIPNIFSIFKDMNIKDIEHNNQTLSYLSALTQIVQILFIDYFKDLELVKTKNVHPIQRILKLNIDENTGLGASEIIISSKINTDETVVIENGFDKSSILELQDSKPYWDEKIKSRFAKIVSNIEKHILIQNN
ncbi:unnamed protein product (macronuclear) [Paramecium tetraurelia]|uniref:Uncharacterized protein n=1 Tax=Paramecium tetraurelia TaxID=5888 RepID=A0CVE8_PARTE|nr:uncharacterized protein GSPATT00010933001 [Paramecium tetraurelia]CAK74765.1 unnamed protein product [Paramecium tetraurelia]|eukprot:XP_001442162.1 hypothetical protein (macronuclear) [Paramecium tetraurelia strain d4-2]